MAIDGITTRDLTNELSHIVKGKRIKKIFQPEKDEIRLNLFGDGENFNLLISANPSNNRIHITNTTKPNPKEPETFCMTLRKHLLNQKILDVKQFKSDRIIIFEFSAKTELGDTRRKFLIVELTGKNGNIILTEESEGKLKVIDSLKRIGISKSRIRQILPGKDYLFPPSENKISFFEINPEELLEELKHSSLSVTKFFLSYFLGLSPLIVRELAYRTGIDEDNHLNHLDTETLVNLRDQLLLMLSEEPRPRLYKQKGKFSSFHTIDLTHLGNEIEFFDSLGELLEHYHLKKDNQAHFDTKSSNLRHQLETLKKKNERKLQNLREDYLKSQKNLKAKRTADLIMSNIWQLEKGQSSAELVDYTVDPPETVRVTLKVNETPSENAQRLYKRYNKAKRAITELDKQIQTTEEDISYLENLLTSLKTSTETQELAEIQYEFENSSLYSKKKKKVRKKPKPSKPLHFVSSEGFDIYVGKNNFQNDYIVSKLGKVEDCWLHVKDAPGSHVLIVANGKFITEQTILEAGQLAAYYSNQKNSSKVAVNYTEFKELRKPKKGPPGFVLFNSYNTMYVTPEEELIEKLSS